MVINRQKSFIRKLASIALLVVVVLAGSPIFGSYKNQAWAQADSFPNEYIFQVLLLPDWRITEAIFAYENDGKYYLPIGELAENFEFFVDMEVEEKLAQGHASREENSFVLDGARNEIIIRGDRKSISEDAILVSDYLATDDLYVQIEVLNQIWPVNMRIELSTLTIFVEAQEELSFMRNKERKDRRAIISSRKESQERRKAILPRRENPYRYFDKPIIDYQAVYEFDTEEDDLVGSNIFTGVQQLGKAIANFSANFRLLDGEIEKPDSIRFNLSRQSAGDEFLLPGIRKAETGDVTLMQRDLISNSTTGRGLTVSNDNSNRSGEFDLITIEGTGPPGWDIELYNNEELIEFEVVPDNGQFFFEDVVLNFGNNQIKILFFGPQGQVREELRSYNAGGNMLSPGKFQYKAGILDADRDFILLDNEPRTEPRGVVKTLSSALGINRWLTIFGNYTEIPLQDKDRNYMTAGAAISTPVGLVEGEAYREVGGGEAVNVTYITQFLGVRTNLRTALFNDFESELSGFDTNQKTSETSVQLNRNFSAFFIPLGLRFNALHTERKNGLKTTDIDFVQTYSKSGVRISHGTSTRLVDTVHERTTGSITTTVREGAWQLRGGLNYELYPETDLSSGNAEIRFRDADSGFQAALNASHNFTTSDYSVGAQAGYDFQKFLGTAETSYDRGNGWRFTLRATTSLHPFTKNGRYDFNSYSRRGYSPVRAHVFLDENADGEFNDGETPIEGARLRLGGGRTKNRTDEDGFIIANAAPYKITNVYLDTPSLEDPYYIPATDGFSTVPIQGKMIDALFPVVETGSIEGTAYKYSNKRAVPGLSLDLIDVTTNQSVMSVETGFDGFYVFEFVRPGVYMVQTSQSHTAKLIEEQVSINPENLYIYGHDLFVDDSDFITKAEF